MPVLILTLHFYLSTLWCVLYERDECTHTHVNGAVLERDAANCVFRRVDAEAVWVRLKLISVVVILNDKVVPPHEVVNLEGHIRRTAPALAVCVGTRQRDAIMNIAIQREVVAEARNHPFQPSRGARRSVRLKVMIT